MIKNEKQYKLTRAQAEKFAKALDEIRRKTKQVKDLHPLIIKAQEDALKSQLGDLQTEIQEYESLKVGKFQPNELTSIAELPRNLIKARIACGLSQKQLAERLGLKEQQIQRYEATNYASVSLARIQEIAKVLEMKTDSHLFPSVGKPSLPLVLRRLAKVGVPRDFALRRVVPRKHVGPGKPKKDTAPLSHIAAEAIGRIFGWNAAQVLGTGPLLIEPVLGNVRFKVTAIAEQKRLEAYTTYAQYLSLLVIQAASHLPKRAIPTDPYVVRDTIVSVYGAITLEHVVKYIWDLGIPVLGLDDPSAFHGACFRKEGRNVIVLKQQTPSGARWIFDLLHELWHAGQESDRPERTVLESDVTSDERRNSEEEQIAGRFAGAILLAGRGQQLAEKCLTVAKNDLRFLKGAVQTVAAAEQVPMDFLANYLAFRLSLQGANWWATAANLQPVEINPWNIVKRIFLERTNLSKLSEIDRDIVTQALTPWREFEDV